MVIRGVLGLFALADARLFRARQEDPKARPVEKVINLLQGLEKKATEEKEAESVSFAKFQKFCRTTANEYDYRVKLAQDKIDNLKLELEDLNAQSDQLDKDIKVNREKAKKLTQDVADATDKRGKKRAKFEVDYAEINEAIEATKKAVVAIKAKASEMESADLDGTTIASFLQSEIAIAAFNQHEGPQPHAFKFSGSHVITTLQKLTAQFEGQAKEMYDEEMGDRRATEMQISKDNKTIQFLDDANEKQKARSAQLTEAITSAEKNKDELETDAKANIAFMKELKDECKDKTDLHRKRNKSQEQELTALAEAIRILQSGQAEFGAAFVQQGDRMDRADAAVAALKEQVDADAAEQLSFLQMQARTHRTKNYRLVQFLQKAGSQLNSAALLSLAADAAVDPFVKVRALIKDMISSLENQADEEADKKEWCDKKEKTAIKKLDDARQQIEELDGEAATLKKEIGEAKDTIEKLTAEIADTKDQLEKGEALFLEQKANAEENLKNANGGKAAVDDAIAVLRKYYGNSFLQQPQVDGVTYGGKSTGGKSLSEAMGDAAFEPTEEYKGQSSTGVLGLLDTISTDYDKEIATLESFLKDNSMTWEDREKSLNKQLTTAEKDKKSSEKEVSTKTSDLDTNRTEHTKQLDIKKSQEEALAALKKTCADTGLDFKARKARRMKEIKSLKEALKILKEIGGSKA